MSEVRDAFSGLLSTLEQYQGKNRDEVLDLVRSIRGHMVLARYSAVKLKAAEVGSRIKRFGQLTRYQFKAELGPVLDVLESLKNK